MGKGNWGTESKVKKINWGSKSKEDDKQVLKAWLDGAKISAEDKRSKFEWRDESSEHPKLNVKTEKKLWYKED